MSQQIEGPTKTFTAGVAIAQHLRVVLTADKLAIGGIADGDLDVGQIESAAFADGDERSVRLASASGTHKMVCAGTIATGGRVFSAAGGKIGPTASTAHEIGVALEAGVASDVIEVLRTGPERTAVT